MPKMAGYESDNSVCELVPVPERGRGDQDGGARSPPFSETTLTGDKRKLPWSGYLLRTSE